MELLVTQPELTWQVTKSFLVLAPSPPVKLNGTIDALLKNNPTSPWRFLIAPDRKCRLFIRFDVIHARGVESAMKQFKTITSCSDRKAKIRLRIISYFGERSGKIHVHERDSKDTRALLTVDCLPSLLVLIYFCLLFSSISLVAWSARKRGLDLVGRSRGPKISSITLKKSRLWFFWGYKRVRATWQCRPINHHTQGSHQPYLWIKLCKWENAKFCVTRILLFSWLRIRLYFIFLGDIVKNMRRPVGDRYLSTAILSITRWFSGCSIP